MRRLFVQFIYSLPTIVFGLIGFSILILLFVESFTNWDTLFGMNLGREGISIWLALLMLVFGLGFLYMAAINLIRPEKSLKELDKQIFGISGSTTINSAKEWITFLALTALVAVLYLTGIYLIFIFFIGSSKQNQYGWIFMFISLWASYHLGKNLAFQVKRTCSRYIFIPLLLCMFIGIPTITILISLLLGSSKEILLSMFDTYSELLSIAGVGILALCFGIATYESPTVVPFTYAPTSPMPKNLLGFSTNQVIADLGQPEQIINLDSKMVYVYKNLKVIFINGQVTDVQ